MPIIKKNSLIIISIISLNCTANESNEYLFNTQKAYQEAKEISEILLNKFPPQSCHLSVLEEVQVL
jgi:hypothetical protein